MAKVSADFQNVGHLYSKYVNTCVNIVDAYVFHVEELGRSLSLMLLQIVTCSAERWAPSRSLQAAAAALPLGLL